MHDLGVMMVFVLAAGAAGCARSQPTDQAAVPRDAAPAASLLALNLPAVRNGGPLPAGAPFVWVAGDEVLCDGAPVASTAAIAQAVHPAILDGLTGALRQARDASMADIVVAAFDANAPWLVVKSVIQTAGSAGFSHAALVGRGADGAVRALDVRGIVPIANAPEERPMSLRVAMRRGAWALVWADGSGSISASSADGGSFADLYDVAPRESAAHTASSADAGLVQPGAVLHVSSEATYADVATAVDALVPTLPVTLSHLPPSPEVRAGALVGPDGGAGTGGTGRLPPDAIQFVLRQVLRGLQFCYERALNPDPSLAGTMRLRLTLEPDGGVGRAVAGPGSTLTDRALLACFDRVLGHSHLPAPQGGRVEVLVPLTFAPDDTSNVSDSHRVGPLF